MKYRLFYLMIIGVLLFTVDGLGQNTWVKTFGGSGDERGNTIVPTTDGGYVLTGETRSNDGDFSGLNKDSSDIFVMKLNSSGEIVWKKTYGGSSDDYGYSITTTTDDGYILTGFTSSNDSDFSGMNKGNTDIFVMKLNSSGEIEWKKTFGGSGGEIGKSITNTYDGGYVLTGWISSNDGDFSGMSKGDYDIFVHKLDSNGDIVWKKTFGGSGGEIGYSIITTSDGGYVITGSTNSNDGDFTGMNKGNQDIFIMKINSNGEIQWKRTFGSIGYDESGISVSTTTEGGFVLTGYTSSNDGDFSGMSKGGEDIFVMNIDSNGNLNNTTSINEFSEPTTTLSVHPNPFSNTTTVSYKVETPSNVRIELLNTLGQTIEVLREDYTDIGTYQLPLNVSTLSSGMYSVRMRSGSMNEVVPVWVVR
jgi:hypothetical protein